MHVNTIVGMQTDMAGLDGSSHLLFYLQSQRDGNFSVCGR